MCWSWLVKLAIVYVWPQSASLLGVLTLAGVALRHGLVSGENHCQEQLLCQPSNWLIARGAAE